MSDQEVLVKSSALGTILSLAALVGVGVLYLKLEDLSEQVRPLTQGRAALDRPAADQSWTGRDAPPSPFASPGDVDAKASDPVTVGDRVAQLERQVEQLKSKQGNVVAPVRGWRMPRFARNMDDLSKTLKLSTAQRDRIEQIIERGKRRTEDVMKIPDAEGRSPHERQQERRKKIEEALKSGNSDGIVNIAMGAMIYRNREIPGQGKTYGEEINRIQKETREEIGRELEPQQREQFDDTRIDGLVGGGGGNVMMTTHWATGDVGEDGIVVVGGDVEVDAAPAEDDRE